MMKGKFHVLECTTRENRDWCVRATPGAWGGYRCDGERFRWFVYWFS